jgi:hypothetical protein
MVMDRDGDLNSQETAYRASDEQPRISPMIAGRVARRFHAPHASCATPSADVFFATP